MDNRATRGSHPAFKSWGMHPLATRNTAAPHTLNLPTSIRSTCPAHQNNVERMLAAGQRGRARLLATSATQSTGEDIWRDSLLRYAGYANEVGESFRNIAPKAVVPSYAVSIAYVLGDTMDKAYAEYRAGKNSAAVAKVGVDVLVWQMLASVAVPGLTINLAVKGATSALKHDAFKRLPSAAKRWAPTAVGLGIIPFIVAPIDEGVTWTMDQTFRKWLKNVGTPGDTSEGPK